MSVKVKASTAELKGEKVTFDNEKDYKAITLKSDGKVYVEHHIFAKKLVDQKLAEYAKDVKLDIKKSTTQAIDEE